MHHFRKILFLAAALCCVTLAAATFAADMPQHKNLRAVAPGESLVEAVKKQ